MDFDELAAIKKVSESIQHPSPRPPDSKSFKEGKVLHLYGILFSFEFWTGQGRNHSATTTHNWIIAWPPAVDSFPLESEYRFPIFYGEF